MPYITLPTIIIPADIKEDLQTGVTQVIAAISSHQPDLIVILLRSAELPFAAVRGAAIAHNIVLPTTINAHIGRELYYLFLASQGVPEDMQHTIASVFERDHAAFTEWLSQAPYSQKIVRQMQADTAVSPQHILVIDDFHQMGTTEIAANHLVQMAFPTAKHITFAYTGELAKEPIIKRSFMRTIFDSDAKKLIYEFLSELLTGYLENKLGLIPIHSAKQLAQIGSQKRYRHKKIYPYLAERYGDDGLLKFRGKVMDALMDTFTTSPSNGNDQDIIS